MKLRHRITAVARREIRRLAAVVERRAVPAQSQVDPSRAAPSFRPLCEAEAASIVGAELLSELAAAAAGT